MVKHALELARMNLVVVGHVDHGKSTIIGRLLADTDSLPEGKLEQVRERCERAGKRFEYAFLLDALSDEQTQGITIDAARVFFKTKKRHYIILDAPGHIEFLKNMVTGASHADAALLVIDAEEGVQENSRRHGYMLSLLGVKSVVVVINKMDLVENSEEVFNAVRSEYSSFLSSINLEPLTFIPVSGLDGDNIASLSPRMPWYRGASVLDILDSLVLPGHNQAELPLRMYVQDVYKFTRFGDSRRIVAGTIESGRLSVGDTVVFYPSGKKSRVRSIEQFPPAEVSEVESGRAVGITLEEQVYVVRGELLARAGEQMPKVTTRLQTSIFWLGREPMIRNKDYLFKVGTAKVPVRLEQVVRVIDAGNLSSSEDAQRIERNQVAECILKLNRVTAFDEVQTLAATGRFVIVDDSSISGGGIIREALDDQQSSARERAFSRNARWIQGLVSAGDRAERYSQRPTLLLVSGERRMDRKALGKAVEARLFAEGRFAYFLGIGNILYGLDADIEGREDIGQEHIRRLAELANIMLDAGMIIIVSAADLSQKDLGLIRALVGYDNVRTIWYGTDITTDIEYDLHLPEEEDLGGAVERIKELMCAWGVLFKPW
jgi:bifunctional enzyme CysN/CysC